MTEPLAPAPHDLDVLAAVRERYARGAQAPLRQPCCPIDQDTSLLAVLPAEILERDYGCGDPSRHARRGDVVLDLGSGAGKVCYVVSQLVGPEGRVIGVDATPEMLELARRHQREVGERIGWHNVEFRRGHIQDLALDHERLEAWLATHPVRDAEGWERLRAEEARLRREEPMVPDASVDLVLSNCVLNLVAAQDKRRLFEEIQRVLRPGGRCAISDVVSDEDVHADLMRDPELWSGCISGALREDRFLRAFADAGLVGVERVLRQAEPRDVVRGIEFRSVTVVAWKAGAPAGGGLDRAVSYDGPWKQVLDDRGHVLNRGEPTAVDRATLEVLAREPYAAQVSVLGARGTLAGDAPTGASPEAGSACCGTQEAPGPRATDPSPCCGGVSRA